MSSKLKAYIAERYPELAAKADFYAGKLAEFGAELHEFPYGFFTALRKGDAFIVFDLYTTREARKTKKAWDLFEEIKKEAEGANVIIGFSEKTGTGREHGQGAMRAAGFVKAYDTKSSEIYFRGVY